MSFIAVGVSVAAVGASAYAAKSASDSAADANKTNQDIANSTNALNYQLFQQSRGSQGNSLLPNYFGSGTETGLANQAYQTFLASQAALGSPSDQIKGYQSAVQALNPAMNAGDTLVNQLFNGQLEQQQQANIAPVLAARGAVASSQKTGILEGLMARLNALSADRARAGYVGGGSAFQKNLLNSATIPALQAAAGVGAQADLQNATDVAGVKNAAINTRLQNLNLPLSQAAARIQLNQLPITSVGNSFTQSLQPFDWFKLQPQAFQNTMPPPVKPVPATGQIAGLALGQVGSSLGNYFQDQNLIRQLNAGRSPSFTTGDYAQQQAMLNQYGQAAPVGTVLPASSGIDYLGA